MLLTYGQFLATVRGDLSNITAPPFLLAPQSIVELPSYWAEKPSIFVAPALEPNPQKRALLVLKWFLCSLKQQCYVGRDVKDGVKKPLNAFLGEMFLGRFHDGKESTRVISEQVRCVRLLDRIVAWWDTRDNVLTVNAVITRLSRPVTCITRNTVFG